MSARPAASTLRAVPDRRKPPAAPAHLAADGRALWRSVVAEFELEPHHLAVLAAGCESLDRMRQAQAAIVVDGPFVPGRWGPRSHPGLAVERDSRLAMVRCLRELGLDLEAPATTRPPTRWR